MRLDSSALPERTTPDFALTNATTLSRERRIAPRRAADRRQSVLANLAHWLVERESQPTFIVDRTLSVLLSNRPARELLRSKKLIRLSLGKLECRGETLQKTLQRVLAAGESTVVQTRNKGPSIRITRIGDDLREASPFALSFELTGKHTLAPEIVQTRLDLTPAEAEVAVGIFNGTSLVAIAKQRRSSINTVKTQARYIFQKCRVRSRVELIRKLNALEQENTRNGHMTKR